MNTMKMARMQLMNPIKAETATKRFMNEGDSGGLSCVAYEIRMRTCCTPA
jgi:hypothetical protein